MNPRSYVLALVATGVLFAPATLAQRGPADNTTAFPVDVGTTLSRTYTSATLKTPAGDVLGKAKAATIETTTGVKQGLRLQLTGLPANTDFAFVIDNTLVGTAKSSETGQLKFAMVSPSQGRAPEIPDAIKPITNVRVVQIYEVTRQQLVATGQFSSGTTR